MDAPPCRLPLLHGPRTLGWSRRTRRAPASPRMLFARVGRCERAYAASRGTIGRHRGRNALPAGKEAAVRVRAKESGGRLTQMGVGERGATLGRVRRFVTDVPGGRVCVKGGTYRTCAGWKSAGEGEEEWSRSAERLAPVTPTRCASDSPVPAPIRTVRGRPSRAHWPAPAATAPLRRGKYSMAKKK